MINPVIGRDSLDLERVDTLQAGHVKSELGRIRASLVVGVDTAVPTEIMLRRLGIELIELKVLRALHDPDAIQRYGSRNGTAPAAHGAIAAADIYQPCWQIEFQFYGAAVAGRPMRWLYFNAIHFR